MVNSIVYGAMGIMYTQYYLQLSGISSQILPYGSNTVALIAGKSWGHIG